MKLLLSKALMTINLLIKPFGAKLVSFDCANFDMQSSIKRIVDHNFKIDNIIDIGASDGSWSKKAMKVFPNASFVAIEPLKEREQALYNLTQKYSNFRFELCAAGEENGFTVILNISDDLDGSTVNGYGGESRQVLAKTIDAIVAEKHLNGSFLLKFDTHGYELPILKGAEQTLKYTSVIILEVYNFQISHNSLRFYEICSYLENLGFRCYDIADVMLRQYDNSLWQMDLFFCRNDDDIFNYPHYK